eukprot:3027904-Pyramimonas_sp.AAC.1
MPDPPLEVDGLPEGWQSNLPLLALDPLVRGHAVVALVEEVMEGRRVLDEPREHGAPGIQLDPRILLHMLLERAREPMHSLHCSLNLAIRSLLASRRFLLHPLALPEDLHRVAHSQDRRLLVALAVDLLVPQPVQISDQDLHRVVVHLAILLEALVGHR